MSIDKEKRTTKNTLNDFSFKGRSYTIDVGMFNQLEIMSWGTPFMASIISICPKTKEEKSIMLGFIVDYEYQLNDLYFGLTGKRLESVKINRQWIHQI